MAFDLAVLAAHPVIYKVPFYKELEQTDDVDLTVYFCSDYGMEPADYDFGTGEKFTWDLPLLEGYEYEFLRNVSPVHPVGSYFSLINPGLAGRFAEFDALMLHIGYSSVSSVLALVAAKRAGIPVLLHGTGHSRRLAPYRTQGLKAFAKQRYVGHFLDHVDAVLADCTLNAEYYASFGMPQEDVYLMPCAVDNDRFRAARKRVTDDELAALRQELGVSESETVVLFVGKLTDRKRPGDLVDAFDRIDTEFDATLVVVGDGDLREDLEVTVADRGMDDVVFAGFQRQRDLPAYYELADLFVLPSAYDASPKALNEAMNFDLPVVLSDTIGTALDLVTTNGVVYRAGSVDQLVTALSAVLSDECDLEAMGGRSGEIVDRWNYERDVHVLKTALADVTGGTDS